MGAMEWGRAEAYVVVGSVLKDLGKGLQRALKSLNMTFHFGTKVTNAEVKKKYQEFIDVIGANENGYITIQLKASLSTRERGGLLLDLEQSLKEAVDESLTVWLEPQADKSKLRKLRGVIVKS